MVSRSDLVISEADWAISEAWRGLDSTHRFPCQKLRALFKGLINSTLRAFWGANDPGSGDGGGKRR